MAWEFKHCGRIRPEMVSPQKIKTIKYKAWQASGFPVLKSFFGTVTEMLKERLKSGVIEPCHGPYRNPWFLVKKGDGKRYRLINNATEINRVTIRDANLPPSADEFSEDFAGCKVASLIDLFSEYD